MNIRVKNKISRKRRRLLKQKIRKGQQGKFILCKGKQIAWQIKKTILHYFPDLFDRLKNLSDYRERKEYKIEELIMGGISLFLFKEGSRNSMNNDRKEKKFSKNYYQLFKVKLPHMDTVNMMLTILDEKELEQLKAILVAGIIEKRIFRKFRFLGKYYNVTVDGSGISSFETPHCEACLKKTSKTGITTYFHNVIEAKLITSSGFSISIATEWISNQGHGEYDKQDCELKAFKRLAEKIKHYFPRLPILITADGLYPNRSFFKICAQNGWDFIVTLQDDSLKLLQEEISWLKIKEAEQVEKVRYEKEEQITNSYKYLNRLEYHEFSLSWVECIETTKKIKTGEFTEKRFVHLTNIHLKDELAIQVSQQGRLRWKIENEGFNTQKNGGYALEHKYSNTSFTAMKNYYQCLQIAHMINQLATQSQEIAALFINDAKFTMRKLWERLKSYFTEHVLKETDFMSESRFQIRLI